MGRRTDQLVGLDSTIRRMSDGPQPPPAHIAVDYVYTKLFCSYYKCKENRHVNSGESGGNGGKRVGWAGKKPRKLSYERRVPLKTDRVACVGGHEPSLVSRESIPSIQSTHYSQSQKRH